MRPIFVLLASLAALTAGASPASALPTIVSAEVTGSTLSADGLSISVVARDPDAAVNAVRVDFGAGEGGFGESACRIGRDGDPSARGALAPGKRVRFDVPFRPTLSGPHDVTITVVSGACGGTERTITTTIPVSVTIPDLPTLPPAGAAVPLPLPPVARIAAAATCAGADDMPTAANLKLTRSATLCLLNLQRAARGLPALRSSRPLRRAATRHSRDMLARHFFDHEGPNGPGLAARLQRVRFWPAVASENLGAGQGPMATPAIMVDAWMHSSGHRTNILTPAFRQVGLGIVAGLPQGGAGATYTADFGAR